MGQTLSYIPSPLAISDNCFGVLAGASVASTLPLESWATTPQKNLAIIGGSMITLQKIDKILTFSPIYKSLYRIMVGSVIIYGIHKNKHQNVKIDAFDKVITQFQTIADVDKILKYSMHVSYVINPICMLIVMNYPDTKTYDIATNIGKISNIITFLSMAYKTKQSKNILNIGGLLFSMYNTFIMDHMGMCKGHYYHTDYQVIYMIGTIVQGFSEINTQKLNINEGTEDLIMVDEGTGELIVFDEMTGDLIKFDE